MGLNDRSWRGLAGGCGGVLLAGVLGLSAAVAEQTPAAAVPIDLRPQWEAGQTARYEFWNRFEKQARVDFAGRTQTQNSSTEVTGEVTWAVQRVADDGSATCTMTLDWMKVVTTAPQRDGSTQVTEVDSRRPGGPETQAMRELLQAMAGVAMEVEVAADGSIEAVKGRKTMEGRTSQPEFLPSELDFVESATDLATLPYAPAAEALAGGAAGVPLGRGWEADFTWDHELGKVDQAWTYRLERVEDIAGVPVAVVTGEAELDLEPELPDRPAGAPPLQVRMVEGSAESEVLFDLHRREALGRHVVVTEKIRVTAKLPDGRTFERNLTEVGTSQTLRVSEE
jgi:hypothetical protein